MGLELDVVGGGQRWVKGLGKGRGGAGESHGTRQESVTRWVHTHTHTPSGRAAPARQDRNTRLTQVAGRRLPFPSPQDGAGPQAHREQDFSS